MFEWPKILTDSDYKFKLVILILALILPISFDAVSQAPGCTNEDNTPGAEACDGDEAASFTVNMVEIVRLEIPGASLVERNTSRVDLLSQFMPIGTFDITVYSVTDYQVTANKTTTQTIVPTGTTGLPNNNPGGKDSVNPDRPVNVDALLEINLPFVQGDEGDADDPVPGASFIGAGFVDLPDTGSVTLWTGGNSEGGISTAHIGAASLRVDLAALENNASGNVYTFQINLRVVEQ